MEYLKSKKVIFNFILVLVVFVAFFNLFYFFVLSPFLKLKSDLNKKTVEFVKKQEENLPTEDNTNVSNSNENKNSKIIISQKDKAKAISNLLKFILFYNLSVESLQEQLIETENLPQSQQIQDEGSILNKTLSIIKRKKDLNQDLNSFDIKEFKQNILLKLKGSYESIFEFLLFLDSYRNIFEINSFEIYKNKNDLFLYINLSIIKDGYKDLDKLQAIEFHKKLNMSFIDNSSLYGNQKIMDNNLENLRNNDSDIEKVNSNVELDSNLTEDNNLSETNGDNKDKNKKIEVNIKYKGFISDKKSKTAIIEYKGKTYFLNLGQYLDFFKLVYISNKYIKLKISNKERVIYRYESK